MFCPSHGKGPEPPACGLSCVEAARPQREEGGARHTHPCSHHQQAQKNDDRDKDMPSRPTLAGLRNAYVFDVTQTDGAELPTIREIGGDVGENRERLFALWSNKASSFPLARALRPHWA